jgi:hypothetical protein
MSNDGAREVIVSCKALMQEIEHVQQKLGTSIPVVWVDRGLHNFPAKLKDAVQDALDSLDDVDRVLMGYANCGNAIKGVKVGDFELIIPKVDDCISILFNSQKAREAYSAEYASMFMTEGWMDADHNIVQEYEYTREKYGDETAATFTEMMYAHYRTMTYLDTGLYSIESLMERTKVICDIAELQTRTHPVGLSYIEQLMSGPWPNDRFVHVGPGGTIPNF